MRKGVLGLLTALILTDGRAFAQTFTGMGVAYTYVTGMSADGSVVVGVLGALGPAWRWTAATGVVDIGSVSQIVAISRDGKTIVGTANDANGIAYAAIWQSGKQWVTLPPPANVRVQDGKSTIGYSVSADGSVIVGLAYLNPLRVEGFRYDAKSGTVPLGTLTSGRSRASVVSADGNVVAGWDDLTGSGNGSGFWYGVIWWEGFERLMNPFNGIGQVIGINDNGSALVGIGHPLASRHAYRFTSWDGHVEDLGALKRLPGGGIGSGPVDPALEDTSVATGVSNDGAVVVGSSGYQPPTDAFIWTSDTKMVKLSDYLASKGITGLEQWTLISAYTCSPDGKIIAGTGINNAEDRIEGYVVKLP
jgi:uncharacterized membrane protein